MVKEEFAPKRFLLRFENSNKKPMVVLPSVVRGNGAFCWNKNTPLLLELDYTEGSLKITRLNTVRAYIDPMEFEDEPEDLRLS